MPRKGKRPNPPAVEVALASLRLGPMVRARGYTGRNKYMGTGGRLFASTTIEALVADGLAVLFGDGVVLRSMLEAESVKLFADRGPVEVTVSLTPEVSHDHIAA